MTLKTVESALEKFGEQSILVVGDLMLDHYMHGSVDRISPEAPVPILEVTKEEYRLGGSGNVADNLASLGAQVEIISVIGKDNPGKHLLHLLQKKRIGTTGVIITNGRPTTMKTRIVAHHQQIVRIDKEVHSDVTNDIEEQVLDQFKSLVIKAKAVIIEDYNKGLLTPHVIQTIVLHCRKEGKLIAVDPKFRNFFAYKGCTLFKPNFSELQKNLGRIIETEDQFLDAVAELEERIMAKYVIITKGEKGLSVYSKGSKVISIPTYAREIYDVSGAGDTVISTLTIALASGCSIEDAAIIANHAAGVVCGKMGTSVAYPAEILQSFQKSNNKR